MYSYKQYLIGFLLLLATTFSSWLVLKSTAISTNPLTHDNADSYMTDVTVMRTNNTDGKLQNQLHASLMTHFPNDTTLLNTPHFIFYQDNSQPWHLTAARGKAEQGVTLVELWEKVILAQPGGTQNQPITINTSKITVHPKQHYAETDQLVTATEPGVHVTATGMHIDFKTQIVDLLSHVQVEYRAQDNPKPQL